VRADRIDLKAKHPSAQRILLGPAGKRMDTAGFVALVSKVEDEGRDLVFLIDGADGLPPGLRSSGDQLLSLSPMTFPHELARVMLAEQTHRALDIADRQAQGSDGGGRDKDWHVCQESGG